MRVVFVVMDRSLKIVEPPVNLGKEMTDFESDGGMRRVNLIPESTFIKIKLKSVDNL